MVLTGASGGVGQALVAELAAREATLCLLGRDLKTLEAVAERVRTTGQRLSCYQLDLTSAEDIENVAMNLRRDFKHVDVLIHAAGTIALGTLDSAPVADLDRQYSTNVRGPYALTRALLPMIRERRGQIVFVNSSAGIQGKAGVAQYAATKHALKAIADSLRDEVNADGIRVLNVFLGRTATPMQEEIHAAEGRPYQPDKLIQPQSVASVIAHALNLHRDAEITEIHMRPLAKPV